MSRPTLLGDEAMTAFLDSHSRWRSTGERLECRYDIPYHEALDVLHATRDDVHRLDHHPVCEIGYDYLRVMLWTHDRGGVTQLDVDLADAFDRAVEGE